MKKRVSILILVVIMISVMGFVPQGAAYEGTSGDYLADIGTKFGRGLINIVSSPAEIPCNIVNDAEGGPWYGGFAGFGKGTVFMLRRILVGACEVGTFMIPMEATLGPVCQMD